MQTHDQHIKDVHGNMGLCDNVCAGVLSSAGNLDQFNIIVCWLTD